jgi:hypothetical protein
MTPDRISRLIAVTLLCVAAEMKFWRSVLAVPALAIVLCGCSGLSGSASSSGAAGSGSANASGFQEQFIYTAAESLTQWRLDQHGSLQLIGTMLYNDVTPLVLTDDQKYLYAGVTCSAHAADPCPLPLKFAVGSDGTLSSLPRDDNGLPSFGYTYEFEPESLTSCGPIAVYRADSTAGTKVQVGTVSQDFPCAGDIEDATPDLMVFYAGSAPGESVEHVRLAKRDLSTGLFAWASQFDDPGTSFVLVDPKERFLFFPISDFTRMRTVVQPIDSEGHLRGDQKVYSGLRIVAEDPTGSFVIADNATSRGVYRLNAEGSLNHLSDLNPSAFAGTGPGGLFFDQSGQFLLVFNHQHVASFAFDRGTGAVSAQPISEFPGIIFATSATSFIPGKEQVIH